MHSNRTLFHGTTPLAAVGISVDKFRVIDVELRPYTDGAIGPGLYLASTVESAAFYAGNEHLVLKVETAPGIRILPLDGIYDAQVIRSLRREFGVDVLEADFARAIPLNKHFERRELSHLLNYLWSRNEYGGKLGLWAADLTRDARRFLKRYRYDGFGDPNSSGIGIVIFNPSLLAMCEVLVVGPDGQSCASAGPQKLAELAAHQLIEAIADADSVRPSSVADNGKERRYVASRIEIERLRRCLRRFCDENAITLDVGTGAALEA